MKRKLLSVLLALVLVLSFSLVTAVPVAAQGDTWYVATDGSDEFGDGAETWVDVDEDTVWSADDTGPWLTISHAISQASDTDTIIVAAGTYYETIDVTVDGLTIQSLSGDPSDTIIDANGADGTIVKIYDHSGVTFSGFTIRGAVGAGSAEHGLQSNSGIYMDLASSCHLSNLIITDITRNGSGFCNGIFMDGCSGNTFTLITISNISGGPSCGQMHGVLIKGDYGPPGSSGNSFTNITIDTMTLENAVNANLNGVMLWNKNDNNTFENIKITKLTAPLAVIGLRICDGSAGNPFESTEISSLTATEGIACALALDGAYDDTFDATTISDIVGSGEAYGVMVYRGSHDNFLTSTSISGLTGPDTYGIHFGRYDSIDYSNSFSGGSISGAKYGVYEGVNCHSNSIHYTDIVGSTEYGAYSDAVALDATNNWWGDDQGPDHLSNPRLTTGDIVSDNVLFLPWLGAPYPDGQVCNAARNEDEWYFTIQAAINVASEGDTINVAAGTYTEHLTIADKSNLTIQSTGDAKIVPTSTPWKPPIIKVDSSTDITIKGLVIDGKNEVDPQSYSWGATATGVGIVFIDSTGTIEGNEIRNFKLHSYPDTYPDSRRWKPIGTGIIVTDNCSQVTIEGNDIESYQASGIRLFYGADDADIINADIINNVITGIGAQSWYSGESIRIDANGTVNIIGNELSNNIYNDEYGAEGEATGVTICGVHGLPVVNITENDILNNTFGIMVEKAEGAVVEAHFNNIEGNGVHGTAPNRGGAAAQDVLEGHGDPDVWPIKTTLNATNNWWGSANGPEHAGNTFNIGSQGDVVSGNVDYVPWLDAAYQKGTSFAPVTNTTQDTKFSSFQAAIDAAIDDDTINVALKDGWTLISTDKGLSVEDWGGALVLKYEGETKGFSEPTTDLEPLTAFYVKTEGGSVSFEYTADPDPDIYFKELAAGWNLISIPSTVASTGDILSPLRYVQAGEQQGVGLATLVSQGNYNQFSPSFYKATLTDADWNALANETLNPVCGYWVYMNAAKDFGVVPD